MDDRPHLDPLQARVDAAAFALLREGKNPRVALVRGRMGGGSPNIGAPALQRWRLTFAGQLDANAASALDVLPPGVLEIVQALWSRALFEAHRVRADARSTADALEQLDVAIRDMREHTARLQAREAAVDAELRDLAALRQRLDKTPSALGRRRPSRSYVKKARATPQSRTAVLQRKKPKARKGAVKSRGTQRTRPAPANARRRSPRP